MGRIFQADSPLIIFKFQGCLFWSRFRRPISDVIIRRAIVREFCLLCCFDTTVKTLPWLIVSLEWKGLADSWNKFITVPTNYGQFWRVHPLNNGKLFDCVFMVYWVKGFFVFVGPSDGFLKWKWVRIPIWVEFEMMVLQSNISNHSLLGDQRLICLWMFRWNHDM